MILQSHKILIHFLSGTVFLLVLTSLIDRTSASCDCNDVNIIIGYRGCFAKQEAEAYFNRTSSYKSNRMTNQRCAGFCYQEGYKFSATHNASTCLCTDHLPKTAKASTNHCRCQCPGDCQTYKCGCVDAVRVYRICGTKVNKKLSCLNRPTTWHFSLGTQDHKMISILVTNPIEVITNGILSENTKAPDNSTAEESCQESEYLDETTCKPTLELGRSCKCGRACRYGTCKGGVCQCVDKEYGDSTRKCVPKLPIGKESACSKNEECQSNFCNGAKENIPGSCDQCKSEQDCDTKFICHPTLKTCSCPDDKFHHQNACIPKRENGKTCFDNVECLSQSCLFRTGKCQTGKCIPQ